MENHNQLAALSNGYQAGRDLSLRDIKIKHCKTSENDHRMLILVEEDPREILGITQKPEILKDLLYIIYLGSIIAWKL